MGEHQKGNGCVTLGYVHPGEVDGGFHESIVRLLLTDHARRKPRILVHGGTIGLTSGTRIATARNEIVKHFLAGPSQPEWLLMIDADMVFAPSALDKLLEVADPDERPIVGGLCFGGGRSGRMFPTLYRLRPPDLQSDSPIETIEDYPDNALVKVDATGAAFLLMHRSALQKMGAAFAGPAPWFTEGTVYKGITFGEDWAFCVRAKSIDLPIYVHTGAKIGHVKPHVLDEELYESYRATCDLIGEGGIAQKAQWRLDGREAIEAPTHVVIPFKGKLDMTRDLVWQLAEQNEAASIILLNNGSPLSDEEFEALTAGVKGAVVIDAEGMTIHQMWNEGLRVAQKADGGEPFNIAFLNNDLQISGTFLSRLATALRADDKLLAVSPRYDDRPKRGVQYVRGAFGAGGMAGFAFMVKGEAFGNLIPEFDEALQWWYGDDDLAFNIALSGHQVGLVLAVSVEHLDGGSQTAGDIHTPEWQAIIAADREHFKNKHGLVELPKEES